MNLLVSQSVVEKAIHMAQVDPHGWIISVVSISLVFLVLFLLCVVYTISGYYFTHRHVLHKHSHQLRKESSVSDEEAIAIAVALHAYTQERSGHDRESGRITIKR